jgi:hypothetical protein
LLWHTFFCRIPFEKTGADFELTHHQRQALINYSAHHENHHHIYQDYEDSNEVLVKVFNPASLKQHPGSQSIYYQTSPCEQNPHDPRMYAQHI